MNSREIIRNKLEQLLEEVTVEDINENWDLFLALRENGRSSREEKLRRFLLNVVNKEPFVSLQQVIESLQTVPNIRIRCQGALDGNIQDMKFTVSQNSRALPAVNATKNILLCRIADNEELRAQFIGGVIDPTLSRLYHRIKCLHREFGARFRFCKSSIPVQAICQLSEDAFNNVLLSFTPQEVLVDGVPLQNVDVALEEMENYFDFDQ